MLKNWNGDSKEIMFEHFMNILIIEYVTYSIQYGVYLHPSRPGRLSPPWQPQPWYNDVGDGGW